MLANVYPIYSIKVLNRVSSIELKPNGLPRWFSDLTTLTNQPANMKEARAFASMLDPFFIRIFFVIHYQNGRTVVKEYKGEK